MNTLNSSCDSMTVMIMREQHFGDLFTCIFVVVVVMRNAFRLDSKILFKINGKGKTEMRAMQKILFIKNTL